MDKRVIRVFRQVFKAYFKCTCKLTDREIWGILNHFPIYEFGLVFCLQTAIRTQWYNKVRRPKVSWDFKVYREVLIPL